MPFLNDKFFNFLVAFYIYIIFFIAILILFIIMSLRLKSGKYNVIWPVTILKFILPIISFTFFGHSLALLISIFKCLTGKLYYTSKAKCQITIYFILMLHYLL